MDDLDKAAIQIRQLMEFKARVEPLLPMIEQMRPQWEVFQQQHGRPSDVDRSGFEPAPRQEAGPLEADHAYRDRIVRLGTGVRVSDVYGSSGDELDRLGEKYGVKRLSFG